MFSCLSKDSAVLSLSSVHSLTLSLSLPLSLSRPSPPPSLSLSRSFPRVQGQIGQVMGVMQSNITKVLERGERLEDLQDKTDDLAAGALTFHKSSSQLRKKMWWKQCKVGL